MTNEDIINRLLKAKELIAPIYSHVISIKHEDLEQLMSYIDSCIGEAIDLTEELK